MVAAVVTQPVRHFTLANHMPWPIDVPFRIAPGMRRLDQRQIFVRDERASVYQQQKRERLPHALKGQADQSVINALAQTYEEQTDCVLTPNVEDLSLGMQEDFVILHDEPSEGFVARFLSVCYPSNWTPASKLGLNFAAIHAPVADNEMLLKAAQGIESIAFRQTSVERFVWLLSPTSDLAQDPDVRVDRWAQWVKQDHGSPDNMLKQVCFRVERQTTLPLPALKRAVFLIRLFVCPLDEVLRVQPGRASQLHAALASMSDAVLAYRGMHLARERLCAALACTP
jgi:hypothetical protein